MGSILAHGDPLADAALGRWTPAGLKSADRRPPD
jgi:hypothetical protein